MAAVIPEPLRVAYLVNQYPTVSHTFIRREIRALEARGVEVRRFSIRRWREEVIDPADTEELAKTRCIQSAGAVAVLESVLTVAITRPFKFAAMVKLAFRMARRSDRGLFMHLAYLGEACQLARWLEGGECTHLHAHFGTNSAEVAMFAHGVGAPPYSFTVHGPEEFDRAEFLGLGEKVRRAKFVVGVSSYGRSQLFRWVDADQWHKVKVVRCGIETTVLTRPTMPPSAAPRLVCIGRLCAQKGQLLLVQAAAILANRGVAFELVLAGDGELRSEIEQAIRTAGLKARVRITGWITGQHVVDELIASRALVLPSFAEGLPVVLMEAMALARPVLATYVAGIPELVRHGKEGWLIPAGDPDGLARAMEDVLRASTETLSHMGQAARERVRALHSVEDSARELAAAFTEAREVVSAA